MQGEFAIKLFVSSNAQIYMVGLILMNLTIKENVETLR